MSGVRKQVDQIISVHIAPFLKEHGFKKDGRNWCRQNPESYFAVNLQTSSWDPTRFTLNLGVHLPQLSGFFSGGRSEIEKRKYHQCYFKERIGALMPGGQDHWWEIDYGKSLKRIGTEMVSALRDFGLPWMEAHLTLESVAENFKEEMSITSAVAALALGNQEEAAKRLQRFLEHLKNLDDRFSSSVEIYWEWGKQHGLIES